MATAWSPESWKSKPCAQSFEYPNPSALMKTLGKLSTLPPLVSFESIDKLKSHLEQVAKGHKFLLQGGDCAELFEYCQEMSLILTWGSNTPVVRLARMGGQYTKPRSQATEKLPDGQEVLTFRGDSVNGLDVNDREPDPNRLLLSYYHAASTLNYVHQLLSSDFADLHHPDSFNLSNWDLDHVVNPKTRTEYTTLLERLHQAIDFMRTIGADDQASLKTVEFYMSHEGLLLDYESCLTRKNAQGKYYDLSAHFLWIGDRTRQLDGAHVEFFRGLENPIGVKVGPSLSPEELVKLLDILDPHRVPGKVTLITRYGVSKIEKHLPGHIQAVQSTDHLVIWSCDPMHGNTETTSSGLKTRRFENISKELSLAFQIHKNLKSKLGGVHFELTGDRVTETLGGSMALAEQDLPKNYQTYCDPRLNYEQSLDIAFMIAKEQEKFRSLE